MTDGNKEIFVSTRNGNAIKFNETDVRPLSRSATGVKAITLREEDYVVSADIIEEGCKVLNVTENGYGKRTDSTEFKLQNRGGIGVKVHQLTDKTGPLVGSVIVNDDEELMLITSEGVIIRLRVNDISNIGRVSQGVKLINLNDGVNVVSVAKIAAEDIVDEEEIVETEEVEILAAEELKSEEVKEV